MIEKMYLRVSCWLTTKQEEISMLFWLFTSASSFYPLQLLNHLLGLVDALGDEN